MHECIFLILLLSSLNSAILYSLTFLFLKVNETQFKVIKFGWLILPQQATKPKRKNLPNILYVYNLSFL